MAKWIPEEVTGKERLVILGREKMLVEQHRGLVSYETEQVRFRTGEGEVLILGKDLVIREFGAFDAWVQGRIESVSMLGMNA